MATLPACSAKPIEFQNAPCALIDSLEAVRVFPESEAVFRACLRRDPHVFKDGEVLEDAQDLERAAKAGVESVDSATEDRRHGF